MPLVAWAYVGFAGGLLAGFSHTWYVVLGGSGAFACVAIRRGSATSLAIVALFVGGTILGGSLPSPRPMRAVPANADTMTMLGRQRARASRAIEHVFRDDAPLAKALLVADQTEIPKVMQQRYADAGIVHMLSISGLHVVIIAMAVELVCQLARLPVRVGMGVTVVIILAYVAVIGFPPPAVRSGVMLAGAALSQAVQRPVSRWAILALGAWVPLVQPETVVNLGYQLSVGGIAGLIASGALARRWLAPRLSGWKYGLARSLLASSVATFVSAPLVAVAFGRISVIAPLTNLVADPIVSLAQPLLFLGLVGASCRPLAWFVADAAHPLLTAFDLVATIGARVPGGTITVVPSAAAAILAGGAAVATIVACVSRFPMRFVLVAATALSVLPWVG